MSSCLQLLETEIFFGHYVRKEMSDGAGLSSMLAAQQDHLIDGLDFSRLGRPTASYIVDRRTVRVPFLAPRYAVVVCL